MESVRQILVLVVIALFIFVIFLSLKDAKKNSFWKQISPSRLLENIRVLSSDEFEGRAPASKGELLSVNYIEGQFKKAGLKPGNPDGTYFQNVPMVGIKAENPELVFTNNSKDRQKLKFVDDFVISTKQEQSVINIDADVVFVGYGVVAPEYNWDDFKDVDVRGKIIVVLVNDPPVPDPKDPSKLDEATFKGKAMTYYGRWTYKFEKAREKGALGCLIVHETETAGYPWRVLQSSTGELFSLASSDGGMSNSAAEGWITTEKAKELFALSGKDFEELKKSAVSRDFHPVDLRIKAAISFQNTIRKINSKNVVGKVVGSDSEVSDEYVIYTAHWDHLGIGPEVNGDKIYHGAIDNASGVAGIIELANSFAKMQPPARRSILFVALTGEEQGLLGSEYYSNHPLYPLEKTIANINIDGMNMLGRARDISIIGLGQSTLDEAVQAVATDMGKVVKPDSQPEKGFYYRGDQFSFAKKGVPSIHQSHSVDFIGKDPSWGLEMINKITQEDYHRPSDKIKPYWDLSGAVEDLHLWGEVGLKIANSKIFPSWKEGSEFKAIREEMLKQR